MKRLLLLFVLLACARTANAQALVNHAGKICGATSCTTTAASFTGSTLLVVLVSEKATGGETITVTDSSSNTWTGLTVRVDATDQNATKLFYKESPAVSSSQTFTCATSGGGGFAFVSCAVLGFSGAGVFDAESGVIFGGTGCTGSTSCAPGSITPAVANEIFVTGSGNNATSGTLTINSGFTISDSDYTNTDENYGMAYLISSGSSAQNPAWNWSAGGGPNAAMAAFRPSGGGSAGGAGMGGKVGFGGKSGL